MESGEYPERPVVAVGGLVFHEGRVLLVRRKNPPSKNKWAIPGGRLQLGETLQEAVCREVAEETGIVVEAGKPVYTFDVIERDAENRIRFHYVIIDLEAKYIDGSPRADDDAADARWFHRDELPAVNISDRTLFLLKNHFKEMP